MDSPFVSRRIDGCENAERRDFGPAVADSRGRGIGTMNARLRAMKPGALKRRSKPQVFAGLVSAFLSSASAAAVAEALPAETHAPIPTLARVIALARDHGPAVLLENANTSVARAELVGARLPGIENPYVEVTGERGGTGSAPKAFSAGGTLWVPLEVGGQRSARIDAANAGMAFQNRLRANAQAGAAADAIQAFGRAVVSRARIRVLAELQSVAKSEADTYRARFAAGDATIQDTRFAEVDHARYGVMMEEAEADHASALSSLELVTGTRFESAPSEPLSPPPVDVRNAADTAPSIGVALSEAAYHGKQRERWEAESAGALSLMFLGGADELGGARLGGGLAYSFPVVRAHQGERARAEAERSRALVGAHIARKSIRVRLAGIERERAHLAEAIAFIEKRAEPAARAAVEAAADMRRLGKGEFLAVLTSRRDLALLRLRHLDLVERQWELSGSVAALTGRTP